MNGWGIVAAMAIWAACIVLICLMLGGNRIAEDDDHTWRR
jgi:hypothetical protein